MPDPMLSQPDLLALIRETMAATGQPVGVAFRAVLAERFAPAATAVVRRLAPAAVAATALDDPAIVDALEYLARWQFWAADLGLPPAAAQVDPDPDRRRAWVAWAQGLGPEPS